ncbi:endonuclease/exonuclease/phosphatase family protein [Streptomyces abyssomicinicus]|uniref:endonuclease/exonuclease/phosphatase family protein n=1 Tax=Streptomyces abyssomicinicus TaxID=574929 RepID=UPI0012505879|nr:endonuclease/exonuclease/phosphatase family protein [Streptomyces abyssomicinicus]
MTLRATHPRPGRRGVLAAAVGALGGALGAAPAVATPAVTAPAAVPSARPVPVRVLTFNIHHGAGTDGVFDLDRVARVIEGTDADVVGLQEVDRFWGARSGWTDVAAELGRRLGMWHVFGANLDLDPPAEGAPRRRYGTAVLTPWPILSWRNTPLPKLAGHEQRGLLRAEIQVRGARLRFAGTHLQHDNSPERQLQAASVRELLGDDARRTVLAGDLNALPDAPETGVLTDFLTDAWGAAGEGDGFTYGSLDPHARIDYLMASADVRVVRAAVVGLDPGASDHLPVLADLLVGPGVH